MSIEVEVQISERRELKEIDIFEQNHSIIFSFLSIYDLCVTSLVSKKWYEYSQNSQVWEEQYHLTFGAFQNKVDGISWKKMYSLMNSRYQSSWEAFKENSFVLIKLVINNETLYQIRLRTESSVKILTIAPHSGSGIPAETSMKLNSTRNIGEWKRKTETIQYKSVKNECAVIESKEADQTLLSWISISDYSCVKVLTKTRVSLIEHYITSQAIGDGYYLINRGCKSERELRCSIVSTITSEASTSKVLQEMISYSCKEIPGGSVHFQTTGASGGSMNVLYASSISNSIDLSDCLYFAINSGDADLVKDVWNFKFLTTKENDIDQFKPIFYACKVSHKHNDPLLIPSLLMKLYLHQGRNTGINHVNEKGKTTLHIAASKSNFPLVQFLIQNEVSVTALDYKNRSPLSIILRNIHNLSDLEDETRLSFNLSIIELIIKFPKSLTTIEDSYILSAITKLSFNSIAISQKEKTINWIISLCKSGISFNVKEEDEHPLQNLNKPHFDIDILKIFLYCGADPKTWFAYLPNEIIENEELLIFKSSPSFSDLLYHSTNKNDIFALTALTSRKDIDISALTFYPLIESVKYSKSLEIGKLLFGLLGNESINLQDPKDGRTAIHYACINSDIDYINWLIEIGVDLNLLDHSENTPIVYCIYKLVEQFTKEKENILKILLENGANPNVKVDNSEYLLHFLIKKFTPMEGFDLSSLLILLLQYSNLDVNIFDKDGNSSIDLIINSPYINNVVIPKSFLILSNQEYLKSHQDQIINRIKERNLFSEDDQLKFIHILNSSVSELVENFILNNNHLELRLLSRTTNLIDSFVSNGETFLTFAAKSNCKGEILNLLVDVLKFSVETPNKDKNTPLIVACQNNNIEFATGLLQRKANPNSFDRSSLTPLYHCFNYLLSDQFDKSKEQSTVDLINLLLENGATFDSSNWPISPIHKLMNSTLIIPNNEDEEDPIVQYSSLAKFLSIIMNLGIDINSLDKQKYTPLLVLCKSKYLTSLRPISYIISLGASFKSIPMENLIFEFRNFQDFVRNFIFKELNIGLIVNSILKKDEHFVNYLFTNYCDSIDLSDHDPYSELTPLIASIMSGLFNITSQLIKKYKVDVNQSANKFRQTFGMRGLLPIHVACLYSDANVVKLLIEYGAVINENLQEYNDLANFPLTITLENLAGNTTFNQMLNGTRDELLANIEIFNLLLDSGASPMTPDKGRKTPMHYAVKTLFAFDKPKVQDSNVKLIEMAFGDNYKNDHKNNLHSIDFNFNMLLSKLIAKGGNINVNEHAGFQSALIIDSNEILSTPLLELLKSPSLESYHPLQTLFNLGAKILSISKKPLSFFISIIDKNPSLGNSFVESEKIKDTLTFQYASELIMSINDTKEIEDKLGILKNKIASNTLLRPSDNLPLALYIVSDPHITSIKLQIISSLTSMKFSLITDKDRRSALYYALSSNRNAVRFCCDYQLANIPDAYKRIPLHYLCEKILECNEKNEELFHIFTDLLYNHSDINHQDMERNTPVMLLFAKGRNEVHYKAIKQMFTVGRVNYMLTNNHNNYLLHILLLNPTLLSLLLETDEDIISPILNQFPSLGTAINLDNKTPMSISTDLYENNPEHKFIALKLITYGFRSNGTTLLHSACEEGNLESVKALVEGGHPVDILDSSKRTPFMIAIAKKFFPIVTYLTPFTNSTVHYNDEFNNTILHMTAKAGSGSLFFLENGAISVVNSKNKRGDTPLHLACNLLEDSSPDNKPLCEISILLRYGARISTRNTYAETPLSIAVKQNSFDAVKLMLQFGTPKHYLKFLNKHNWEKKTPTDLSYRANPDITKYLILHGGTFYTLNQHFYHQSAYKSLFVAPERIHRILEGEIIPLAKSEETAIHCFSCQAKFSFLVRKTLCKCCGFYHCTKCTSRKSTIPAFKITQPIHICKFCYNVVISHNTDHYFLSEYFFEAERKNFNIAQWSNEVANVDFIPSIKYCLMELSNTIPDSWYEIYQSVETASKGVWVDLEDQSRCIEFTIDRIEYLLTFVGHMQKFHTLLKHCYNYFLKFYFSMQADLNDDFFKLDSEEIPSIISISETTPKLYSKLKKFYTKSQQALQNQTLASTMGQLLTEINYDIINYSYSPKLQPLKLRLTILANFLTRVLNRKKESSDIDEELTLIQSLLVDLDPILPSNLEIAKVLFNDYFMMELILNYYENSIERLNQKGDVEIETLISSVHEKIDQLISEYPTVKEKKKNETSTTTVRIRNDEMVFNAKKKLAKLDEDMFDL